MTTSAPPTLTHWILSQQQMVPEASGNCSIILHSLEIATKYISSKVRSAGLLNLFGVLEGANVSGDTQKKLDVLSNDAMKTCLKRSHKVGVLASEEDADAVVIDDPSAHYVCVFDPLDGSSNIDVNISIGTIFGIYRRPDPSAKPSVTDALQTGTNLVAAGYALYGSATLLMVSTGHGVHGFTLDPSSGEFVLTHQDVKIKHRHTIYSVNEGNCSLWHDNVKNYVESVRNPEKGKPYSCRYVGSMVADVHRTLIYGGIFMYPADKNSKDGKLRLLYEANPMAFLVEQAGGKATTGNERILEITPTSIHQRVPVFMGSPGNVDDLLSYWK